MTRVAVYARVSSDAQRKEGTIAAQLRDVPAFCQARGWTIVDTYVDDGKSAATGKLGKREAFTRLLADAAAGRFDVVAVFAQDRITRSTSLAERGAIMGAFQAAGVKIAITSTGQMLDLDTDEGDLMGNMGAYVAAAANRSRVKCTAAGKETTILNGGKPRGVTPIGLTYVKGDNKRGIAPTWGIDPAWSPIVREAYQRTADRESSSAIARDLNQRGIRRPRGRFWTDSRIRQLVTCETYTGRLIVDHETGRSVPVPAIIDADLATEARAVLSSRYRKPPPRTRHHRLLCGLATCGVCGLAICVNGYTSSAGTPHHYYVCRSRRLLGAKGCSLPIMLAATADEWVWGAVSDAIANPVTIDHATATDRPAVDPKAIEDAIAELRRLDTLQAQALDHAARGLLSPEVSSAHIARLGRDRKAAERTLRAAQAAAAGIREASSSAAIDERVGLFRRWTAETATPEQRRVIVRRSLQSIEVHPNDMVLQYLIDVPTVLGGAGSWSNAARVAPQTQRLTVLTPRRRSA